MKPSLLFRRPPLFHLPFWIVFHTLLFAVNVLFSHHFFPDDPFSFWLALANASAQTVALGFFLLLFWDLGIGRFFHSAAAERLFYSILGFLAVLYLCHYFYFQVMGTSLVLFLKHLWRFPLADVRDLVVSAEISIPSLLVLCAGLLFLPATLWYTAKGTLCLSKRWPVWLPSWMVLTAAILSLGLAGVCQWTIQNRGDIYRWSLYAKALPVYLPIVMTGGQTVTVAARVRPYERLDRKAAELQVAADHLSKDISVFIVVSETVRQDFVVPEHMPNLHRFVLDNFSFRHSFCSGNSTHYSWFATLFGAHPIYWNAQRNGEGQLGSPALQILKKAGFRIHLYSKSHHLKYLGFGELIFGENNRLIDEAVIAPNLSVHEADQDSVGRLKKRILGGLPPGRHVYLLFLDSTHHRYFFPEDYPNRFFPYSDDFSYLKWRYSPEDVAKIRNRYKNALHYLDSLFGQLLQALKETGAYERSWIGFVADHGEEFMEHGALIHGSNHFDPQMRVPICFRKPGSGPQRIERTIAGIDFFPTLLDMFDLYKPFRSVLQGRSAFEVGLPHLAVLANNNGAGDPFDFVLYNGSAKLHFLLDRHDPRQSRHVNFTGAYDRQDQPISFAPGSGDSLTLFMQRHFSEAIQGVSFLACEGFP